MKFSDIYILRLGAGVTLPGGCSGFAFQGQPPAVLPTSSYGQGLAFRFVLTPGVWAISGEVSVPFDGRDADPSVTGAEVAYAKLVDSNIVRFSIVQPAPGGTGLDYVRLASVSAPVLGVSRQYHCLIGIPTLTAELAAAPSGAFARNSFLATAHVGEGATARPYSLARSVTSVSADLVARRVAIAIRLIGTPMDGVGPDVELGNVSASAPIDASTGNFSASLSGSGRIITGAISGKFFGPQAVEVGMALGGAASATADAPAYSFAGAAYGAR